MFRRLFTSALGRGLPLAAAAVTTVGDVKLYTDKEMSKKPKWFGDTTIKLENIISKLSLYQFIESESFLHEAIDLLNRVEDVNNFDITWRLGRALVEDAEWISTSTKTIGKKIATLEKALGYLKKALENPVSEKSAAVHKWYGIGLKRLYQIKKKHPLVKNADNEIAEHLEKAIKLDPNDPFLLSEAASYYYESKNYKTAINKARAAEKLKENFSNVNLLAHGASLYCDGQKEEGVKVLKRCVTLKPENIHDVKAWFKAKSFLIFDAKIDAKEVNALAWEY